MILKLQEKGKGFMSENYFYTKVLLPDGFRYPLEYIDLVHKGELQSLSPWWFLGKKPEFAELCFNVINEKLGGEKILVPFAKTDDDGDIACFDGNDTSGSPRIYFDTGEENMRGVNWDERYSIDSFSNWLEMVLSESSSA